MKCVCYIFSTWPDLARHTLFSIICLIYFLFELINQNLKPAVGDLTKSHCFIISCNLKSQEILKIRRKKRKKEKKGLE